MAGNEQALIDSFGDWAEGSQAKCVEVLEEKGIEGDLDAMCAWMKDQYEGSTDWRGKGGAEPGSSDVSVPKAIGAIKMVGGQPAKLAFKKGDKVAVHVGPQTSTGTVTDDAGDNEQVPVKHDADSPVDYLKGKTSKHDPKQVKKAAEKGANKDDFAYTPSDDPADWKLDISSAKNAAGAAAALSSGGFRGQKADIPPAKVGAVKAKVRAAYKKFFPDRKPEDYPDSIKAAEEDEEDEGGSQPKAEERAYDSAKVYLGKLYEVLKPTITKEQWDKAVRTARSHAGGKAPRSKAAYDPMNPYGVQTVSYDSNGDLANDDADETPGNWDEDADVIPGTLPKLSKGDARVKYRAADKVGQQCGSCKFIDDDDDACVLVEGTIQDSGVCDLWTDPGQTFREGGTVIDLASACALDSGTRWRLFFELPGKAGEPPTRIPYLPRPGLYTHPQWGTIEITRERNQRFVENFNSGVYQKPIPLDAEHQTKLSGAMGWIKTLTMNEDGSVDANDVEWTGRGRALLAGGAYKFVSPEWYDEWQDPATNKVYSDVAIGGALTTRPFFKDGPNAGLRPLMAASEGLFAPVDWPEGGTPDKVTFAPLRSRAGRVRVEPRPAREPKANSPGGDNMAVDPKAFAELQEEVRKKDDQLKQMSENLQAATTRVESLETRSRAARFADIVGGRNGHAPWTGKPEDNVAMLEKLAKSFGEESDDFKAIVAARDADADALKKSALFTEQGSPNGGGSAGDDLAKVEETARKRASESDGKTSYERAFTEEISKPENTAVYAEYMAKKGLKR